MDKGAAVGEDIRRRRWRWLGHTLRKPSSSIGRQALNWNPQGQRKRGRPRNTWRRELEKNIKRTRHTWKQLERIAQDRGDWRVIVGGLCKGPRTKMLPVNAGSAKDMISPKIESNKQWCKAHTT